MPNQVFTGYVHDSLGVVVVGARADLYATSDLTTSVANDTTDANGQWTIPHATAGIFSVKITNGSVIHWLNYEDQVSVQGVHMGDDGQLNFGNANDATILWSDADADNHAMVIGLGDDNTVLHITNRDGMATDWAVSANAANAEIRIHSDTTPATDYMRLGGHTGTIAYVDVVGGTTLELQIGGTGEVSLTSTVLAPVTSDGNALGSTSLMWADLFLASGSVINFNNGDITLTHSANTLTVAGGTFAAAAITGTTIDASTDFTIGDTVITDGVITDSTGLALAANVTVTGNLLPNADDTYDLGSASAAWQDLFIEGDITLTDAGTIATSAGSLTLTPTTDVIVTEGTGMVIGHTGQVASQQTAELQVLGTTSTDASVMIGCWNAGADNPILHFVRSENATIGTTGAAMLPNGAWIGQIYWTPDDGTDFANIAAIFGAVVDDASPAANDIGTAFVFDQQPGGGGSRSQTMKISADGTVLISRGNLDLNNNDILNVGSADNEWTANSLILASANAGGLNAIYINNSATSDTASHSTMQINAHSGGGNTKVGFSISGGANWHVGVDNDSSDILTIGPNTDPGGNDGFRMTNATPPVISFNTGQGSDFDFACGTCGKTSSDMFSCCGVVRWRDDVMDYRAMSLRTPDALDYMERVGVIERTFNNAGEPEIFTVQGKNFEFAMSAAFQNRQRMDAQYEELKAEIETLKGG